MSGKLKSLGKGSVQKVISFTIELMDYKENIYQKKIVLMGAPKACL